MLPFGFVLSRRAPLQMHLFGSAEGHNGPRAMSKIMKWVLLIVLVRRFLWPKRLLFLGAIMGGGENEGVPDVRHGGCPGSDPDPPLPWRSKTLRRSGPDLAQTWRQRRRKFFSLHMVGGKFSSLADVWYTQNAWSLWGIQICMQNMNFFLTPDLPHPAPPTWLLGPDPPEGNFFFKKPDMCVFKMTSATRGSF